MSIHKSKKEGASLATAMTKRELIAMHVLAAYCNGPNVGDSYRETAEYAVRQTEALLLALTTPRKKNDACE